MKKHPIQPLEKDKFGTIRFKQNKLVDFILENCNYTLNDLAHMDFEKEDWEQFAQLIGYSLNGFCELSYANTITCEIAEKSYNSPKSETELRNEYLENKIQTVKESIKNGIACLFDIHSDNL